MYVGKVGGVIYSRQQHNVDLLGQRKLRCR